MGKNGYIIVLVEENHLQCILRTLHYLKHIEIDMLYCIFYLDIVIIIILSINISLQHSENVGNYFQIQS